MMQRQKQQSHDRRRQVLFAAIAEYLVAGRPVSSAAIVENHALDISPATVRRYLQILTDEGLLNQPHTSAGRLPTDSAFRLFIDALSATHAIEEDKKKLLAKAVRGLRPGSHASWQELVRLLSDLAAQASFVVTPAVSNSVLRQLKFIWLGPGSLLAVVITREGMVQNAFVECPEKLAETDLEQIHNYLGSLVEGRSLNQVRRLLRKELVDARQRCDALREQATLLGAQAIQSSFDQTVDLVVEGRSRLLAQPDQGIRLKELLRTLEEKSLILDLLDRAAAKAQGPIVIIGQEGGEHFEGCTMITYPFGNAETGGQIGVIGPTRMDYPTIIPLVTLSAQSLSDLLSGKKS